MSKLRLSALALFAATLPGAALADFHKLNPMQSVAVHASFEVDLMPSPDHLSPKEVYLLLSAVQDQKVRSPKAQWSERDLQMIQQFQEMYPAGGR